jgi:hypothetical protein
MFAEKFNLSADIQKGRRIVDFAKAGRICGFVPGKQLTASRLGRCQLLRSIAERAARVNRLRDRRGQMVAFELREGGVKNLLRIAQLTQ